MHPSDETEKTCKVCGETKSVGDFYMTGQGYRNARCKACQTRIYTARRREQRSWPKCPDCGRLINVSKPHTTLGEKPYHVDCAQKLLLRDEVQPIDRADCPTERPCPIVHCRLNMLGEPTHCFDADPFRGCIADVLDSQPYKHTLQEIGDIFGVSRERIRQIEEKAIAKLKANCLKENIDPDELLSQLDVWHVAGGVRNRQEF